MMKTLSGKGEWWKQHEMNFRGLKSIGFSAVCFITWEKGEDDK